MKLKNKKNMEKQKKNIQNTEGKRLHDSLTRAGALLTKEFSFKGLSSTLVDQALDITEGSLAAFYLYDNSENAVSDLHLYYKRGYRSAPKQIKGNCPLILFLNDCEEAVVLNNIPKGELQDFTDIFISPEMKSGVAVPVSTPKARIGVLILNSLSTNFFNRNRFNFITSFTSLAGGMLHNSRLFDELKEYLQSIEQLKMYQESIFSSMTNMLITTDPKGGIEYMNEQARSVLSLSDEDKGRSIYKVMENRLDKAVLRSLRYAEQKHIEIPGIEGIYDGPDKQKDFQLNLAPLLGKRGKPLGQVLLFTDQSREKELKQKMKVATEERRVIKDMFSRYLSQDLVSSLMKNPEQVRPGGDKKKATIFFADIRGYTSFSEGRDPEEIIEVLNKYFSEAVEIIIKYGGFIDKFIGDCIMAAWGVPLVSEEQDAINAVKCAIDIQSIVGTRMRDFFKEHATDLRVGIGMHTGELVAGNLGSEQRMDYSVIGDTVNVASRLEGIAGPNEIIITQDTRNYLGDDFIVEERDAVHVKGKKAEIPIYSVIKGASK